MNLFSLPPHLPFLDAVAGAWLAESGDDPLALADGLILLPTRRAARALAEAFLRAGGGRPMLLPRITAIGALDEAGFGFAPAALAPAALAHAALALPPAVAEPERLAQLSRLVLGLEGAHGAPRSADRAWALAAELAGLMDEAERAGVDLGAALGQIVPEALAEHWQTTLRFLEIVTAHWPGLLAARQQMNPVARQMALIGAQAEAWAVRPPRGRILAAGIAGGIRPLTRLLRVIAGLPRGAVLLAGLDTAMDEAAWEALGPVHPQYPLRQLLDGLGARREDARPWPFAPPSAVPAARAHLLSLALRPAAALDAWRREAAPPAARLFRLEAADEQHEAAAIALVLREALETPGARAALVTPDRVLAGRVSAELLRFGIVADDSAGEPLPETPPAVLLRLLARAVAEQLAPVPLLALLKHPLAAAGLAPAACRAAARALELACLRGPRPVPGITGLRLAVARSRLADAREVAAGLLERVEHCLEPLIRLATAPLAAPAGLIAALVEAAERLAATDDEPGAARLWAGEEGAALAEALAPLPAALAVLPDEPPRLLPGLLDALIAGKPVRGRRALRGREAAAEHPRVFIWGLLEARLQAVDTIVLGGLVEGVWPPATDPGPWLSRPMRLQAGLPPVEERVGEAAHDFVAAACAAPVAVLSCPRRREGAPAVPARWLARLAALLPAPLEPHPAAAWAAALDQPAGAARAVAPPAPRPPVALRPRRLSVTEIETWLRDPYAIHARHILRLAPLDALDQETEAADYGTLVHAGLHRFVRDHGTAWPADPEAALRAALDRALAESGLREALRRWWAPRLDRIAAWLAEEEGARRALAPPVHIGAEIGGRWRFWRPGGPFELTGRADRIERRADGSLAILDYKTGTPPSESEVAAGLAPQLPLEAAMAAAGAFGPDCAGVAAELLYWQLTGGATPGKVRSLLDGDAAAVAALAETAAARLADLIDAFDDPARAYLAQPHPGSAPRFPAYARLARVAEWSAAGDGE